MDYSIIDKLYEIYKNEPIIYAELIFKDYAYNRDFLETIQAYIKEQASYVANYFVSNKDENLVDYKLVQDIVSAFENVIMPVDYLLVDVAKRSGFDYDNNYDSIASTNTKPHDLFKFKYQFLEEAVSKYGETCVEDFDKIKDLIKYVKKNKILKKIYKDDSWYDLDFEEVIYALYDYIEDKKQFNEEIETPSDINFFLFEKIKENCSKMLADSYDKFRPQLNSKKQMRTDFGKLIFCKNLLMFYKTDILPDNEGFVDFTVNDIEHMHLLDNFKKLYSKKHNETKFRNKQGNFICCPEVFSDNYKLEGKKCIKLDDKFLAGFIVSCSDKYNTTKTDYLIHIQLNDFTNSYSDYEMHISIIPHGNLNNRLQLMRLDNWASEQVHRNIAKKLSTVTHVHLYNEFDLLRGKTNGAYDIAYNLDKGSTAFESSLKTFLAILELDSDITKDIYNSTLNALNECRTKEIEK